MEFFNSKKFITIMFVWLLCAGLFGCGVPKNIETQGPKQPTTLETIGKLDAIATVLGCMFDPKPCQEKVKEQSN